MPSAALLKGGKTLTISTWQYLLARPLIALASAFGVVGGLHPANGREDEGTFRTLYGE
ncbi:hypothetical protein D3C76_1779890 [compost metagenome]